MPRLWTQTIESHRREVRDAILDAAAGLAVEGRLHAVTMSAIAERASIGRATLYKYFPDVDAVLLAWHERQVTRHLAELAKLDGAGGRALPTLQRVLETYALMSRGGHGAEAASLHQAGHVAKAHRELHALLTRLVAKAAREGDARRDVPAGELASYCLHALGAAGGSSSKPAVRRLVAVTLAGLRAPKRRV